jgi:glycosyltransferase involved in cell wall biosynthesis
VTGVTQVGVVVPARDEELLLPECLASLRVAADAVRAERAVEVIAVVVLDSCRDDSALALASHPWARRVDVSVGNVGAARRAGAQVVLDQLSGVSLRRIWLATTDADSQVPPGWLIGMVDLAAAGTEVVVGTVTVDDWSPHPPPVAERWLEDYARSEPHPHVHGANLGLTAAAYLAAGGFPAATLGEDVALVTASAERRVVRTTALPVRTSGRAVGRVTGGFADFLKALADDGEAV